MDKILMSKSFLEAVKGIIIGATGGIIAVILMNAGIWDLKASLACFIMLILAFLLIWFINIGMKKSGLL